MSTTFPNISPMALSHHLKVDPNVPLLDVRSPLEYRSGHIPGARLAPLNELETNGLSELAGIADSETGKPVYLTCHAGDRAERAAKLLRENGLQHVVLVQGGTQAWRNAGLPVNKCGNIWSLERQVQITVGSLLLLKVFFGFAVHELFFLAVAAIGAGLITAGMTRWCGMAQIIARMPWNRRKDCGDGAHA